MTKTLINRLRNTAMVSAGLIALTFMGSAGCTSPGNSDAYAANSAIAGYNRDMATTRKGYAGWNAAAAASGALSANASRRESQPNVTVNVNGGQNTGNRAPEEKIGWTIYPENKDPPKDVVYKGELTWTDGDNWKGDILNGHPYGEGVYTWIRGMKYAGAMKDSKREGFGTYTDENGKVWPGYWRKDNWVGANKEDYDKAVAADKK